MRHLLQRPMRDELWSSMLVRSVRRAGLSVAMATRALTGTQWTPSFFSVCHLHEVAPLLDIREMTAVGEHTVVPYTTAYFDDDLRSRVLAAALTSGRAAAGMASVTQSVSDYVPLRRYCQACARSELFRLGESYWHVSHNLPGVLVCPIHRKSLHVTEVPTAGRHLWSYALPHEVPGRRLIRRPPNAFELELTRRSIALLGSEGLTSGAHRAQQHRDAFVSKGLLSTDRSASAPKLTSWLQRLMSGPLGRFGLSAKDTKLEWASLMVRPAAGMSFPPVKHLILESAITVSPLTSAPFLNHGFPRFTGRPLIE